MAQDPQLNQYPVPARATPDLSLGKANPSLSRSSAAKSLKIETATCFPAPLPARTAMLAQVRAAPHPEAPPAGREKRKSPSSHPGRGTVEQRQAPPHGGAPSGRGTGQRSVSRCRPGLRAPAEEKVRFQTHDVEWPCGPEPLMRCLDLLLSLSPKWGSALRWPGLAPRGAGSRGPASSVIRATPGSSELLFTAEFSCPHSA